MNAFRLWALRQCMRVAVRFARPLRLVLVAVDRDVATEVCCVLSQHAPDPIAWQFQSAVFAGLRKPGEIMREIG